VNAVRRTRKHLEAKHLPPDESIRWIPCHAIDLSADGRLDAHVDSVKFSGDIVAGLSLLSDSIMRLKPCSEEWKSCANDDTTPSSMQVDMYLPQLSLYVLSGMSRFTYTHELLPSGSTFESANVEREIKDINVERGRRLSIIFRDKLRADK
jgi:alkylated DNA repair protein alkB family protein 7